MPCFSNDLQHLSFPSESGLLGAPRIAKLSKWPDRNFDWYQQMKTVVLALLEDSKRKPQRIPE